MLIPGSDTHHFSISLAKVSRMTTLSLQLLRSREEDAGKARQTSRRMCASRSPLPLHPWQSHPLAIDCALPADPGHPVTCNRWPPVFPSSSSPVYTPKIHFIAQTTCWELTSTICPNQQLLIPLWMCQLGRKPVIGNTLHLTWELFFRRGKTLWIFFFSGSSRTSNKHFIFQKFYGLLWNPRPRNSHWWCIIPQVSL